MSVREVILRPEAPAWGALMRARAGWKDERGRQFRAELGLPTDAPIVMTGHQPWVWHCGILAKYIACDAAATALGGSAAWVWVDQDEVDPFTVRAPEERADGALEAREYRLGGRMVEGAAIGSCPAAPIEAPADSPTGVRQLAEALGKWRGAPSAGAQAAGGVTELMARVVAPRPALWATGLWRTALFAELVDRMARDPLACARAYNASLGAAPGAGLATLARGRAPDAGDCESPLWRLRPGAARQRVYAAELRSTPLEQLAPRALLLTLLLRLAGCDLFIHGVGGGEYDRATEAWARAWLGEELAPMTVVSATVTMDRAGPPTPTGAEVARARWLAHHARHAPEAIGDSEGARRKAELLGAVRAARAGNGDALSAYRALQEFLEDYRRRRSGELDEARRRADATAARHAAGRLLEDRTWAFPLHADATLGALRSAIRASFSLRE